MGELLLDVLVANLVVDRPSASVLCPTRYRCVACHEFVALRRSLVQDRMKFAL